MSREPIYVEIRIRCGMDDLWRLTQTPELHRRWDLRFTDIEYLPRPDEAEPQRFTIEPGGNYYPPQAFMTVGYWAWDEKIANMLPLDYKKVDR